MSLLTEFLSLPVTLKLGSLFLALCFLTGSYKTLIFVLSKKTQGTIVSYASGRSQKGGAIYYPVFTYTTEDGQEFTVQSSLGTRPPRYSVGQQVPIHYLRFAPKYAKITAFTDMFLSEFIFGFIGFLLFFIGILDLLGVLEFLDRIGLIDIRK